MPYIIRTLAHPGHNGSVYSRSEADVGNRLGSLRLRRSDEWLFLYNRIVPAFAEVSKIEEIDIFPQATGAGGELR